MTAHDATQPGTQAISKVTIGTRRSQLAIAQVDSIIAQLKTVAPEPQYVSRVVSTMADENQVKAFSAFDSKSIWTEELEQLLMQKELDVVVHCLKGWSILCAGLMTHRLAPPCTNLAPQSSRLLTNQ